MGCPPGTTALHIAAFRMAKEPWSGPENVGRQAKFFIILVAKAPMGCHSQIAIELREGWVPAAMPPSRHQNNGLTSV
jgi:hypothetical protein